MRPLFWIRLTAAAGIACILTAPALAQKAPLDVPAVASPGPTPVEMPVAIDPPPAPPTPSILTAPIWLERPDATDFSRYFPHDALVAGISGRVVLECLVAADGRLACAVLSEEPLGYGFNEAGLRVSRHFRMAPQTREGAATAGGRVRVPIRFVAVAPPVPPPER